MDYEYYPCDISIDGTKYHVYGIERDGQISEDEFQTSKDGGSSPRSESE